MEEFTNTLTKIRVPARIEEQNTQNRGFLEDEKGGSLWWASVADASRQTDLRDQKHLQCKVKGVFGKINSVDFPMF